MDGSLCRDEFTGGVIGVRRSAGLVLKAEKFQPRAGSPQGSPRNDHWLY